MKPKDFRTELEPVWCTGCGDYGVLKGMTQALADLEIAPEKLAVISGIGCSSRLPGYVKAYSFNSIHGRALPIASGLQLSRPEMTTVVVGGDGDGFSIGLGHIPHCVRRDVDLTYAVLDNGIYGLTKGQATPTTDPDLKREPGLGGANGRPLNPGLMLLGSGCGFVARTHAGNMPHLRAMFREAIRHPGFAFVHVLAACVTYQPGSYAESLWKRWQVLIAPGVTRIDFENGRMLERIEAAQVQRVPEGWRLTNGWRRTFDNKNGSYEKFSDYVAQLPESPDLFGEARSRLLLGDALADQLTFVRLWRNLPQSARTGYPAAPLVVGLNEKFVFPLLPLAFVMLAVALGASGWQRRGSLHGFGVAILIVFAYWVTHAVATSLGREAIVNPVVVTWVPIAIVFAVSGGLLA